MAIDLTVKPKTFRGVSQETLEQFAQIHEQLDSATESQTFEALVDRFYSPIKADKEQAAALDNMKQELLTLKSERDSLAAQLEEWQQTANQNAEALNAATLAHQNEVNALHEEAAAKALKETQRVVDFVPDVLKALEAVAARESKRRNQQWTVSHVINFFIDNRIIRGRVNGGIDSLSDKECKALGIELGGKKQKQEGATL